MLPSVANGNDAIDFAPSSPLKKAPAARDVFDE